MKGKIFADTNNIIHWMPENPTGDLEGVTLAMDILEQLVNDHKPAMILVDLSKGQRPDAASRQMIISTIKRNAPSIKKNALCGHSPLMKAVAFFVINTSGYKNMRFFPSRHEASAWLMEE